MLLHLLICISFSHNFLFVLLQIKNKRWSIFPWRLAIILLSGFKEFDFLLYPTMVRWLRELTSVEEGVNLMLGLFEAALDLTLRESTSCFILTTKYVNQGCISIR